jgi:hypothetical protein
MLANKRLPDQLDVAFGPQAIISRFILQGERNRWGNTVYHEITFFLVSRQTLAYISVYVIR